MYNASTNEASNFSESLRTAFEQALDSELQSLPAHVALVEYAMRSGHRTRPVGCLLSCAAVDGDWRTALRPALAVELIHKSSVIRDDIVDGDQVRSGQEAFHVAFGVAQAITVSDLLWSLALRQLSLPAAGPWGDACLRASAAALHEMASGQLEDVAPSADRQSVDARRLVEERKTGALSELACRLGAITGGGDGAEVEALGGYGRDLGTAFQLLNDVRNLRGEESSRGAASDLRKRRDTVLSAYARESAAPDALALRALRSGNGDLPEKQVVDLRERLISAGAAEFGEAMAADLMQRARSRLDRLSPSLARGVLESLTDDALLAYAF